MSATHTPTPWVLVEKPTTAGTVFKVGSHQMVDGTHGGICLYDDHTSLNPHIPGTQEANAEFIVRACNSHDDLMAALEDMMAWARAVSDEYIDGGDLREDYRQALSDARDALSAARGAA